MTSEPGDWAAVAQQRAIADALERSRQAPKVNTGSGPVRLTGWRHGHMAGVGMTLYYEIELAAPMDHRQLYDLLFEGGRPPPLWTVAPLPPGTQASARSWLIGGPYYGLGVSGYGGRAFHSSIKDPIGKDLERQFLGSDLKPTQATWFSQSTVEALTRTGAPPAGADLKLAPKDGATVYVWREGDAWYWYDTATGELQGFRADASRSDVGSRRYNHWVVQYIERGLKPADAMDRALEDMQNANIAILGAFGMALSGAGGLRKPPSEGISTGARGLRGSRTAHPPEPVRTPEPPPVKTAPSKPTLPESPALAAESGWLLGDKPSGPAAFQKTAQLPGSQTEKAKLFERLVQELKARTGWNAERTGTAIDGSIVYHGEAQAKALVITRDGHVFTGSWGQHVKLQAVDKVPKLVCDWSLPGWKQW
jgi:hypothetical protein